MILQINQVAASGSNQFEILENGRLLFKATAPFYKPATPVGGEVFRELTLFEPYGGLLLRTAYVGCCMKQLIPAIQRRNEKERLLWLNR